MSNRPVYESAEDRGNQRAIARYLACLWKLEIVELSPVDRVDFVAYTELGYVRALIEIKCRGCYSFDFSTYMVAKQKIDVGLTRAGALGVPLLLVVQWRDRTMFWKAHANCEVRDGGRRDRGDAQDVEPCYFVPISWFQECAPVKREPWQFRFDDDAGGNLYTPTAGGGMLSGNSGSATANPP